MTQLWVGFDCATRFTSGTLSVTFERDLDVIVRREFRKYDRDGSGAIDTFELGLILRDIGQDLSPKEVRILAAEMDTDNDGSISLEEFRTHFRGLVLQRFQRQSSPPASTATKGLQDAEDAEHQPLLAHSRADDELGGAAGANEEDEEEEAIPEDIAELAPEQQQRAVIIRAVWMMTLGLVLILFFSDPMVDVLSGFGAFLRVPPFYVSFVLSPLASNASELIASMNYASKKTRKTIVIGFQALLGAGSMNNTFCLAVFAAILFARKFAWEFTAETISIVVVEAALIGVSFLRKQSVLVAMLVFSLYPLCIAIVAILENVAHLN